MFGSWSSRLAVELTLVASVGASAAPAEKGVALGLFASDPEWDYGPLIAEIAETGATHVAVVWVWWQDDVEATTIRPVPGKSATDAQVHRTLVQASAAGLHVTAFPIVRLLGGGRTDWRGKIRPTDEDAWWQSYDAFILHAALVAKSAGADRLSVGSELLSRERMRARWLSLIDRVRLRASSLELMYSANWDHYRPVSFWDAVDVIGLTAYWELTKDLSASTDDLARAWAEPRSALRAWSKATGRTFVFTEIGYPSIDGGAAWPWDETRDAPVDLDEQVRAYCAFVRVWSRDDRLAGAYFWNWFGFGGPQDGNYTPRGKPAADVIRRWYRDHGDCAPSRLRP